MTTALRTFAYAGMAAPYTFQLDISPSSDAVTLPDLTVVTAVSLVLSHTPQGAQTWTTTIVEQTATLLRVSHLFAADGTDIAIADNYWMVPHLSTPGGVWWADPALLVVKPLP